MPKAHPDLAAKFPGMDQEAMEVLETNFFFTRGFVFRKRIQEYQPTPREIDAINYMVDGWDWVYDTSFSSANIEAEQQEKP